MPAILEVDAYRRVAARTVGRRITGVDAPDEWFCKGVEAGSLVAVLPGHVVTGIRRLGKLLLVETEGPVLGLRFGMTGRILVDGVGPIDRLEYSSARDDPAWHRFGLRFAGGGSLTMVDPRRLGGVSLDPDLAGLGPDALSIGAAGLRDLLAGSRAPLKARLMDQARLAGLGNLLCDEILWRAGLEPARPAGSLDAAELRRLHRHLRATLEVLGARGGSHTGDLHLARLPGGRCPRCGGGLLRRMIGGRTTYSCAAHQR